MTSNFAKFMKNSIAIVACMLLLFAGRSNGQVRDSGLRKDI
jgi:hypothetical protein